MRLRDPRSRFDPEAGAAHLAGLGLAMLSTFPLTRVLGSGLMRWESGAEG